MALLCFINDCNCLVEPRALVTGSKNTLHFFVEHMFKRSLLFSHGVSYRFYPRRLFSFLRFLAYKVAFLGMKWILSDAKLLRMRILLAKNVKRLLDSKLIGIIELWHLYVSTNWVSETALLIYFALFECFWKFLTAVSTLIPYLTKERKQEILKNLTYGRIQ